MNKTHRRRTAIKRKHTRRNRNKIGGFCLTQMCKEKKYKQDKLKAEKLIEDGNKKLKQLKFFSNGKKASDMINKN